MQCVIKAGQRHLDEVSPNVVVVGGGDGLSVLRDDLQGLQHFVLRPAEVRANTETTAFHKLLLCHFHFVLDSTMYCLGDLCRRAFVIVTAMFSQAAILSPLPAASQPSRAQHSSKTQSHLCAAGTA